MGSSRSQNLFHHKNVSLSCKRKFFPGPSVTPFPRQKSQNRVLMFRYPGTHHCHPLQSFPSVTTPEPVFRTCQYQHEYQYSLSLESTTFSLGLDVVIINSEILGSDHYLNYYNSGLSDPRPFFISPRPKKKKLNEFLALFRIRLTPGQMSFDSLLPSLFTPPQIVTGSDL